MMIDVAVDRRRIDLAGTVQGVGFRPFVQQLASRLGISGFVTNTGAGVSIEAEAESGTLDRFARDLIACAPALAHITSVTVRAVPVRAEPGFRIAVSTGDGRPTLSIPADLATCAACVAELFDSSDRRYRYPFITCTQCGPRLTIVTGAPYDRERTTMASFQMCAACQREYTDPADRRFHAETIACAACGPRLTIVDGDGRRLVGDPIRLAAEAMRGGRIVAVKGLGGFHLACDATDAGAVAGLRSRKHRDHKPFAIMLRDLDAVRALCVVSDAQCERLSSPAHPIVLLRRAAAATSLAADIAPDVDRLGVMLPYTPIHHLLFDAIGDRPLVMTSGNRSDEPIAIDNAEALSRLAGIADLLLVHDRSIHVRCDDSVIDEVTGTPLVIRRSRGYAPAPVQLAEETVEPILAVGGQLKNTFAIARGRHAFLSHHIGDLDELRAFEAYQRDIVLFEQVLGVRPGVVAYDSHPDYASTRAALERDAHLRIPVQHHHAHVASCIAEHAIEGPVIGLAWDGAGWGPDQTVWGGEFLVGDCRHVERAGHFRYVSLPGGDRAAREPWRMALSHLSDAGLDATALPVPSRSAGLLQHMIATGAGTPRTSSVGRLFDAVSSILGLRHTASFEGQAAMQLQALAERSGPVQPYGVQIEKDELLVVDTRELISAVSADRIRCVDAPTIARRFHATLAMAAMEMCRRIRPTHGTNRVVLTGGVFQNALLAAEVERHLVYEGFEVYRHRIVPPGDGGLSLGQVAVAAAVMKEGR